MITGTTNGAMNAKSTTRLGRSVEPSGMAGTSWNSVRWTRPTSGYRTSRLANAFETGGSSCSSSLASSCSSSLRAPSPPHTLSTLRSSERASSAASRPQKDAVTVIRPNSRFGTSFLNPAANTNINGSFTIERTSKSLGSALSPQQEQRNTSNNTKTYPYRTMGLSQPRATLLDIRQNLRPVKRHTVTGYQPTMSSTRSMATSNKNVIKPLTFFTNAQNRILASMPLSTILPISKCVSPPSMSRSSSTVTSPITSPNASSINIRPIPKSERPWRQKLADSQRLREAQEERGGSHHNPLSLLEQSYETNARLLAARTARRASIEHQQQQKHQSGEQRLEKEIAALKCYVSEPGALDKNATVAKFRQRMNEGQFVVASALPTQLMATSTIAAALNSASSLLARMPSLSRRVTTAVCCDTLQQVQQNESAIKSKEKERPLSMIETPIGPRRLSIVRETAINEIRPEMPMTTTSTTLKATATTGNADNKKNSLVKKKTKESPKMQKKTTIATMNEVQQKSSQISTNSKATGITTNKNRQKKQSTPVLRRKKKEELEQEQKLPDRMQVETHQTNKQQQEQNNNINNEDENCYNAIVQFKPQSMLLRRKLSAEHDGNVKDAKKFSSIQQIKKTAEKDKTNARCLQNKTLSPTSEPKPVPGTWERGTPKKKERFISQNRHLIRKSSSESAVHIQPVNALARVYSVRLLAMVNKKGDRKNTMKVDDDIQKHGLLQNQNAVISMKSKGSPTASVLKMIKSIASSKPKQRVCAVAVVDKQFANKRTFRLGIRKTLLLKSVPQKLCAYLRCRSAQFVTTNIRFNILWKEQKRTANVNILLADWERVVSGVIHEPKQQQLSSKKKRKVIMTTETPLQKVQDGMAVVDKENNNVNTIQQKEQQRPVQIFLPNRQQLPLPSVPSDPTTLITTAVAGITSASAALAAGPATTKPTSTTARTKAQQQQQKAARPPVFLQVTKGIGESASEAAPLILPDLSVLEQFVQRKRDALERLHEQPIEEEPPGSITKNILNTVSLPGSNRNSQMLATAMPPTTTDQLLPHSMTNSFHAILQTTAADLRALQQQQPIIQHRLRRPQPELTRAKLSTQAFEKPKSLFEEQMQRQAVNLLKQKAARQSLHEASNAFDHANSGLIRRKSATSTSGEHSTVAQTIIAQPQRPQQQREQSYAAHIPLHGRQSTASIDVSMLDTTTRQLLEDQMHAGEQQIARSQDRQQQNKFKEAIDYLDHIFEDFQRDAATADDQRRHLAQQQTQTTTTPRRTIPQSMAKQTQQQHQQQQPSGIEPIQATFRPGGQVKFAKEAFEKAAAAIANEKKATAKLKKQTSVPAQTSFHLHPQPVKSIVNNTKVTQSNQKQQQQQFPRTEVENDVDVAETIVLPSKNTSDRLDFTRHWLTSGNIRTWAEGTGVINGQSRRDGGVDQLLNGSGRKAHESDEYNNGYESDEHSLGSCSAEVAAINASNQRMESLKIEQKQNAQKKQGQQIQQQQKNGFNTVKKNNGFSTAIRQPQHQKNGQHQMPLRQKQQPPPLITATAATTSTNSTGSNPPLPQIVSVVTNNNAQQPSISTIRPQPYRPQPQLGVLLPGIASEQMHKVASSEQLRLRTSQERACSQDYQSMGSSVHSQEGFRPTATCLSTHSLQRIGGGAFHSYTPIMMPVQHQQPHQYQLKGSIQSLPDSALVGQSGTSTYTHTFGTVHQQPQNNNPNNGQFATLGRADYHNRVQQGQPQRLNVQFQQQQQQQLQPSTAPPHQPIGAMNEHTLAIDALVAELDLNTDQSIFCAEKRRSFPTMQTEVGRTKVMMKPQSSVDEQQRQQKYIEKQHQKTQNGGLKGMNASNGRPLDELSELLLGGNGQQKVGTTTVSQRKLTTNSAGVNKPFETINQEKLNPSKVDAMTRIFDHQNKNTAGPSVNTTFVMGPKNENENNNSHQHSWNHHSATTGRMPSSNRMITVTTIEQQTKGRQLNQPLQSNNSSRHGGAGDDTTTTATNAHIRPQLLSSRPQPTRSLRVTSSRTINNGNSGKTVCTDGPVSMMDISSLTNPDDNILIDDCNYDNIQSARQRPRPSPRCIIDDGSSSLSSQGGIIPPSPTKSAGGRIGQLIRKLGNVGNEKPPINAASMVSLNRISNEPLSNGRSGGVHNRGVVGLAKSNSLSGEPWRCQILAQQNGSDSLKNTDEDKPQHNGIGNRLKQTIFGGMVRRRVPT